MKIRHDPRVDEKMLLNVLMIVCIEFKVQSNLIPSSSISVGFLLYCTPKTLTC